MCLASRFDITTFPDFRVTKSSSLPGSTSRNYLYWEPMPEPESAGFLAVLPLISCGALRALLWSIDNNNTAVQPLTTNRALAEFQ